MSARGLALKRVLDVRADGILVSMVNNAAIETVLTRAHSRKFPGCLGVCLPDAKTQRWLAKGANFILAAKDTAIIAGGLGGALAHM
jgi:2-keto-3-deoxy-L-rhamnonate aldolase RhmA